MTDLKPHELVQIAWACGESEDVDIFKALCEICPDPVQALCAIVADYTKWQGFPKYPFDEEWKTRYAGIPRWFLGGFSSEEEWQMGRTGPEGGGK